MFFQLSDGRVELLDHNNFRSFKVVVDGRAGEIDRIARGLPDAIRLVDPTTAWISQSALRAWPSLTDDAAWRAGVDVMIEKAGAHGWVDPDSGAIRAHIEWRSDRDACVPREDLVPEFKRAMRRLASTVSIVCAMDDGAPHGMTATAVTSLAMDPPSLVICINQSASIHAPLLRAKAFCVNLLRAEHRMLCADFSGKKMGAERFSSGDWVLCDDRPPRLRGAQANIFCQVDGTMPYGTHTIVIGRVEGVMVADSVMPLLHQDAGYGSFSPLDLGGGESVSDRSGCQSA